jgi:hypothetical protein
MKCVKIIISGKMLDQTRYEVGLLATEETYGRVYSQVREPVSRIIFHQMWHRIRDQLKVIK